MEMCFSTSVWQTSDNQWHPVIWFGGSEVAVYRFQDSQFKSREEAIQAARLILLELESKMIAELKVIGGKCQ